MRAAVFRSTRIHDPVRSKNRRYFNALAPCGIEPPQNMLHCNAKPFILRSSKKLRCREAKLRSLRFVDVWRVSAREWEFSKVDDTHHHTTGMRRAADVRPRAASRRMRRTASSRCLSACANLRARSQHRHRGAAGARGGARIAGPHRADARRRCAAARVRHRGRAHCSTRAARSRPAIRCTGSIRGRSRSRCSRAKRRWRRAKAVLEQAAQQARRIATLDQPARRHRGRERKGHRGDAPGRSRRRGPQGRRRARKAQSRLRHHPRADRRHRRRRAGQRRRAGGAERSHQSGDHPAARSDLCRLHPVGQRTQSTAPRASRAAISTASRPMRRRSASCSTTARSIRSPANCCSPKPRSTPIPGR